MDDITDRLSEFVARVQTPRLPPPVVHRVKALMLDLIGIAIRARFEDESAPPLLRSLQRLGQLQGDCSIIADRSGGTAPGAALVNGALAHALDFDDTHARASLHPSAPVVPAAFAASELTGANGETLIAGIVAGYEVAIRLGLALVAKDHYERGFHPTATCGAFGATAAAGRILGLTPEQIASAFGLVGSLAAGSMQFLEDGAWNKRFHTGYAAMNGVYAAVSAAEGYRGAKRSIEGRAGFLRGHAPHPVAENAIAGLGIDYETLQIGVKPYPSCRYGHAALDAVLMLREKADLQADEIERLEIGLPATGHRIIGEPLDAKQHPKNVVDAQFSMPFVAAIALREGRLSWDDYAPHLADPATQALAERITAVVDPWAEAQFPSHMSGVVRVATRRGRLEEHVVIPKGEPENFLTDDELARKFEALAAPYLPAQRIRSLCGQIWSLETLPSATHLLAMTRAESSSARH